MLSKKREVAPLLTSWGLSWPSSSGEPQGDEELGSGKGAFLSQKWQKSQQLKR